MPDGLRTAPSISANTSRNHTKPLRFEPPRGGSIGRLGAGVAAYAKPSDGRQTACIRCPRRAIAGSRNELRLDTERIDRLPVLDYHRGYGVVVLTQRR
jgi:hypothetical protein